MNKIITWEFCNYFTLFYFFKIILRFYFTLCYANYFTEIKLKEN